MKYTYVNNGMSKLIVVFNSFIQNNDMSSKQLQRKISFPSLPMDFEDHDFLYVHDAFCNTYGWYAIDDGKYIYQELAAEIDEFIVENNYLKEDVTAFGSSKGGYGALLHGLLCKNIGTSFSAVPQINLDTYFLKKIY